MKCPVCGEEMRPKTYEYLYKYTNTNLPPDWSTHVKAGYACSTHTHYVNNHYRRGFGHGSEYLELTDGSLWVYGYDNPKPQNIDWYWTLIRPGGPPKSRKVSSQFIGTRVIQI